MGSFSSKTAWSICKINLKGNQMKFADPKNDIAFKKIFGDEHKKEILLSFLNAILDFKDEKEIVDEGGRYSYY